MRSMRNAFQEKEEALNVSVWEIVQTGVMTKTWSFKIPSWV